MARAGVPSEGCWASRPRQDVWGTFLFCGGGGGSKAIMSSRVIRDAQRRGLRFARSRDLWHRIRAMGELSVLDVHATVKRMKEERGGERNEAGYL